MKKYLLAEKEIIKVPRKPGIYKIHSVDFFLRLKGETDILYIGKAQNLKNRLKTFVRGKGRKAIGRFENLKKSSFKLTFSFQQCQNPKEKEKEELQKFERKHLELPPLNHSGLF
jgi:excinuclease UvrABC nuclease subunit